MDSAVRRATHRAFAGIRIDGEILDVGGARKNRYHTLIGGDHRIRFANFDAKYEPDLLFDVEQPWPVEPGRFDAVIMSHLLEHLYRPWICLDSAFTALKPGGRLVGAVPFLYRIHAGPSDYYRYTHFALQRMLEDAGYSDIKIEPLCTGAFSVAFDLTTKPLQRGLGIVHLALQILASALDWLASRIRPRGDLSKHVCPSGYFFTAVKAG